MDVRETCFRRILAAIDDCQSWIIWNGILFGIQSCCRYRGICIQDKMFYIPFWAKTIFHFVQSLVSISTYKMIYFLFTSKLFLTPHTVKEIWQCTIYSDPQMKLYFLLITYLFLLLTNQLRTAFIIFIYYICITLARCFLDKEQEKLYIFFLFDGCP